MARELFKLFMIILFSMIMHLAILQVRFKTNLSSLSSHRSTEVGLVDRHRWSDHSSERTVPVSGATAQQGTTAVTAERHKDRELSSSLSPAADEPRLPDDSEGKWPVALDAQQPMPLTDQKLSVPERNEINLPVKQATADNIEKGVFTGRGNKSDTAEKEELKTTEVEIIDKVAESPAGKAAEQMTPVLESAAATPSVARLNGADVLFSNLQGQTGSIEFALQSAVPRYDLNPAPVYPDIARRKGLEGRVLLKVMVSEDGSVDRVEIISSSGFTALDRSALKAVRRWQFVPAMSAGVPVASGTQIPINFDLP